MVTFAVLRAWAEETNIVGNVGIDRIIPVEGYRLVWSDEFEGTNLDLTKWAYRHTGVKRGDGVVAEDTVSLDGRGHLVLTVRLHEGKYLSPEIATLGRYETTYGYFECRVKLQRQIGHFPAFWLQTPTIGQYLGDPGKSGTEIDIFEYLRMEGDKVHHTLHWDGYGENHKTVNKIPTVPGFGEGWHTVSLLWTEKEYVFYIDDIETWRTDTALSHRSQYIILSTIVGVWAGDIRLATLPDFVYFDYVRVYKKKP